MQETPKKLVERHRCFTCSLDTSKKVYIFGKSSIDFGDIIRSCLGVDVHRYSAQPGLFICKPFCYKKLIKFQRASEHLEEVRKEILESFQNREQPRIKRQIVEDADNCDENQTVLNRAAKSLKFGNTSAISPQSSLGLFNSPTIPIGNELPHIITAPKHLTSTPISEGNISRALTDSPTVKLSVRYPSETLNKTLCKSLKSIGKTLAHGNPSQIANAVMNCPTVKEYVLKKNAVTSEQRSHKFVL